MKPRKCPRCELNYILDGEELCPVCRKAFSRSEPDELENICVECGTNPALPGEDYCQSCLAAKRRAERENAQQDAQEREDDGSDEMREDGGMEDLEIDIPDDEIPETELAQIEDDLDYDDDEEEDGDAASDDWKD